MDPQLQTKIAEHSWYHTIEVAPGVFTPGWFDTRSVVKDLPFPASLVGKRCLDVGTFDGFWAYEMERRGSTDVTAIDVLDPARWDWPSGSEESVVAAIGERKAAGSGFLLAHEALGSKVQRFEKSVYELDPEVDGIFDFVYVGSLLLHLRDPVGALMKVRAVCREQLLLCDAIDGFLSLAHPKKPIGILDGVGRPWWWKPNLAALVRMVEAAGFERAQEPVRVRMPAGAGQGRVPLRPKVLRSREGREAFFRYRTGDPHGAILAKPR